MRNDTGYELVVGPDSDGRHQVVRPGDEYTLPSAPVSDVPVLSTLEPTPTDQLPPSEMPPAATPQQAADQPTPAPQLPAAEPPASTQAPEGNH